MLNRQHPKYAFEFAHGTAKFLRRGSDDRWRTVGRSDVEAPNFTTKMRQFRESVDAGNSAKLAVGVFMPSEDIHLLELHEDIETKDSVLRDTIKAHMSRDIDYEFELHTDTISGTKTLVFFDSETLDEAERFLDQFGFKPAYFSANGLIAGRDTFPYFRHKRTLNLPVVAGFASGLTAILAAAWFLWPLGGAEMPETRSATPSTASVVTAAEDANPVTAGISTQDPQTDQDTSVANSPQSGPTENLPVSNTGPSLALLPEKTSNALSLPNELPKSVSETLAPLETAPEKLALDRPPEVVPPLAPVEVASVSVIKRPVHRPDSFKPVPLGPKILIPKLRPDNLVSQLPEFDTASAIQSDMVDEAIRFDAQTLQRLAAASSLATGPNQRPPKKSAGFQSALNEYVARKVASTIALDGAGQSDQLTADDQVETRASAKFNKRALSLVGVFGSSKNRTVMFRTAGGSYRKIKLGQKISGWKLVAVGESSVKITKGGQEKTLRLPG